ncbi:RING finger protein 113A, putative [Entamoeba invadens IP1]|uniref:RING finger protein 113A, putative n=1 Tax=Entamoeba invadens IP1 TaxID=370355 RepID=A0A0A1TY04_ENTIV|nr:RING finger protein 113A, putative [Entamoeba invadens IP1]ELP83386.1 RING finger protein 113A, putative [Entamoeba invadens IP1]|eukprot:XP_004182732.1 RING finger protein 113A, putative [Entamoeba invadens IP1]
MSKNNKKAYVIPKGAGQTKNLGEGLRAKEEQISTHFKKNTYFDYQPELCKDYYETGYCGYGDNCKFIHDRSLTKSSLTLEREFDERQKRDAEKSVQEISKKDDVMKKQKIEDGAEEAQKKVCPKCKKEYDEERTIMVMKCGHYICCDCCIGTKKCPLCDKPTTGVFNKLKKRCEK